MATSSRGPNYFLIAGGAFALIVGAIIVALLAVDEIHKAQIRAAIQAEQDRRDAESLARAEQRVRDDEAITTAQHKVAEKPKPLVRTPEMDAADAELAAATESMKEPIVAATRKEEVEESDRRMKRYLAAQNRVRESREAAGE